MSYSKYVIFHFDKRIISLDAQHWFFSFCPHWKHHSVCYLIHNCRDFSGLYWCLKLLLVRRSLTLALAASNWAGEGRGDWNLCGKGGRPASPTMDLWARFFFVIWSQQPLAVFRVPAAFQAIALGCGSACVRTISINFPAGKRAFFPKVSLLFPFCAGDML